MSCGEGKRIDAEKLSLPFHVALCALHLLFICQLISSILFFQNTSGVFGNHLCNVPCQTIEGCGPVPM